MNNTGIVRRVDELGRVVIPKEYRKMYGINIGDPVEIKADDKGNIILTKYTFLVKRCATCSTHLQYEFHYCPMCGMEFYDIKQGGKDGSR